MNVFSVLMFPIISVMYFKVCFEGEISKTSVMQSLSRGKRASGDLIPWTVSQQVGGGTQHCGSRRCYCDDRLTMHKCNTGFMHTAAHVPSRGCSEYK